MSERLFCKIFVDAPSSENLLRTRVAAVADGRIDGRSVVSPWAVIDVVRNSARDDSRKHEELEGFLFYSHLVEMEPEPGVARADYAANVGRLLEALWMQAFTAVAACDFEDELPHRGGYRWPIRPSA